MIPNLVRTIFSKRQLFIALAVAILSTTAVAVWMNHELANVAIDAVTRATDSGYSYFSEDVSVLTDQRFPENDSTAVKLTVANNGMIIFDLDTVYTLHNARLYVGEEAGGYCIDVWLGGWRADDGGARIPQGERVIYVQNFEFVPNTWVEFPFPSNTHSDNVELNVSSGADLYEFELYAENKKIYTSQEGLLPLTFMSVPVGTEKNLTIDISDSLADAEEVGLKVTVFDIDDTSEVKIYVNDYGPLIPPEMAICPDTFATFIMNLDVPTLKTGENEIQFVYAADLDNTTGGFSIEQVALVVTFGVSTNVQLTPVVEGIPIRCRLLQNYPNPFNASTIIEYELAVGGKVSLVIFNTRGRKVRTLANEEKPPSLYRVVWDGKTDFGQSVASGLYFYKLRVGNFVQTHKLICLQ